MQRSVLYTLGFATAICIVCAIVVSASAVSLKERQEVNKLLDKKKNVLEAAGLKDPDEDLDPAEVDTRFANFEIKVIDLTTGQEAEDVDPATFDQRKRTADPATSVAAPDNLAQIQRLPNQALVYELRDPSGALDMVILPIEGKGLWSTLYGFLALDEDLRTIQGITFYEHGETPGLGGEVDNPRWKAKWVGRLAFGPDGEPQIEVVKGSAGPPSEDPYEVDGLSGATITSRGVTFLVQFWLGEGGFGPYLDRLASQTTTAAREAA